MQPVASKHIQCSDRALTVWGISSLGNVSYCIPFVFFFHHFLPMCCPTHNILFSATNKKKIIIKKKKKKTSTSSMSYVWIWCFNTVHTWCRSYTKFTHCGWEMAVDWPGRWLPVGWLLWWQQVCWVLKARGWGRWGLNSAAVRIYNQRR